MGRGRGGASQQASRRAVDLTGVLAFAEKNDLLTLITAITEKMLKDICNIFDSPPISPIESEHGHHHWLSLPHFHHKENMVPSCFSASKSTDDKTYAKTHQIIEKEEKEAMTPQLQELKKEALVFFRKWQNLVLQRVKDISIAEPSSSPANARGRGRGNNRGGPRGRGGRGGRTGRGGLTLATGSAATPFLMYRDLISAFTNTKQVHLVSPRSTPTSNSQSDSRRFPILCGLFPRREEKSCSTSCSLLFYHFKNTQPTLTNFSTTSPHALTYRPASSWKKKFVLLKP